MRGGRINVSISGGVQILYSDIYILQCFECLDKDTTISSGKQKTLAKTNRIVALTLWNQIAFTIGHISFLFLVFSKKIKEYDSIIYEGTTLHF